MRARRRCGGHGGVPLVVGVANDDPERQRVWLLRRICIWLGFGIFAIAAATAASMLPEEQLGTKALSGGADLALVLIANPLWLLCWGVRCRLSGNDPSHCFSRTAPNVLLIVLGSAGVCMICAALVASRGGPRG